MFLNKMEIELAYESANPLLGIHWEEIKSALPCVWQHDPKQPRHGKQVDILLDMVDEQPIQATWKDEIRVQPMLTKYDG